MLESAQGVKEVRNTRKKRQQRRKPCVLANDAADLFQPRARSFGYTHIRQDGAHLFLRQTSLMRRK
jgi:hypothetical protein